METKITNNKEESKEGEQKLNSSIAKKDVSIVETATEALTSSTRKYEDEKDQNRGRREAVDNAFNLMNTKKNGILDAAEIGVFLEAAAKHVKLKVGKEEIEDAVEALMDDAKLHGNAHGDGDSVQTDSNHLTRWEFFSIFDRHPDMLRVFGDLPTLSTPKEEKVLSRELAIEEVEETNENEDVYDHAHWKNKGIAHWKNKGIALAWIILYVGANVAAFTEKGIMYADHEATAVVGNCVIVARGSAQCLNLNAMLILLPICRHFITYLRHYPWIQYLFPFDAVLDVHMWIGLAIALFTTAHVAAHICDFHRFSVADQEELVDLFGDKLGPVIPENYGERWLLMIRQRAGITGIIMVVCMLIAYPVTLTRRKHFNRFWILHHLFLVMLTALCFHGTGNLLEPFQSVYWVVVPLVLYVIPRVYREMKCSRRKVLDVVIKEGGVVEMTLEKPASWENHVRAGMYGFVNIPAVSRIEWHPFTLTSSPKDDFIRFHFARAGDWTGKVHNLLQEMAGENKDVEKGGDEEDLTQDLTQDMSEEGGQENNSDETKSKALSNLDLAVYVEGPIGASSQGYSKYPIIVLIGAGIGVTPMISVLRQLLVEPGKMVRTYFYWTVRHRAAFQWFEAAMDDVYEKDQNKVLKVRHFLTSVEDDDRDLGAALLHYATRAKHRKTNFDLIQGRRSYHQVQVGRPDWEFELESIQTEATQLGHKKCGIFLCGPKKMSQAVDEVRFSLSSKKNSDFHFYFTKETF